MTYQHTVEQKIMWGDLDSLGIVFYPHYYEWFDGCAHLFFESIDMKMGVLKKERGIGFGLIETGCRYFKPLRYHETIRITTRIGDVTDKTILLNHSITPVSDSTLMVEGFEKRMSMDISDPDHIRAIPIPSDLAEKIRGRGSAQPI
jgi:YbgC/YbaW family acyl-CoA thioester hydrolase